MKAHALLLAAFLAANSASAGDFDFDLGEDLTGEDIEEAMEEEEGGRENRAEEERGMLELEAELPLEELLRRYREMAGGEDEGKEQEEDEGGSERPADLEDDRVVKDLEMAEIQQPEDLKGASQAAATTQPTGNTLKTTRVKVQPAMTSSPPSTPPLSSLLRALNRVAPNSLPADASRCLSHSFSKRLYASISTLASTGLPPFPSGASTAS